MFFYSSYIRDVILPRRNEYVTRKGPRFNSVNSRARPLASAKRFGPQFILPKAVYEFIIVITIIVIVVIILELNCSLSLLKNCVFEVNTNISYFLV